MNLVEWAAVLAGAYVAGSLPFGYIAVRALRGVDVRTTGSGNTGATNVWRGFGRRLGIAVLALDALKGFAPAIVGAAVGGAELGAAAGLVAMVGHAFPVFLGLGGGKGVATGAGAMIALCPLCFGAGLVAFLLLLYLAGYVSLASIAAAVAIAAATIALGEPWPVIALAVLGGLGVVVRHRANFARLRAGTEPRVTRFSRRSAPTT